MHLVEGHVAARQVRHHSGRHVVGDRDARHHRLRRRRAGHARSASVIAACTIFFGLIMVALPVGIIATAFAEDIHRRDFVVTWGMVARVPLFAELDAGEIADIMQLLRAQTVEPGDGHRAARRARRSRCISSRPARSRSSCTAQRARLGVGHFFGEIAVLQQRAPLGDRAGRRDRAREPAACSTPPDLHALDGARPRGSPDACRRSRVVQAQPRGAERGRRLSRAIAVPDVQPSRAMQRDRSRGAAARPCGCAGRRNPARTTAARVDRRDADAGRAVCHRLLQVLVDLVEEAGGRQPLLVGADQEREVLGHVAGLDGVDHDLLQRGRELRQLRRCCRAWRGARGRASRRRSRRPSWSRSPGPSGAGDSAASRCRARPPPRRPCRPASSAPRSSGRASRSPAPRCRTARRRRSSCRPRRSRPTTSSPPPPCRRSGGARR